MEWEDGEVRGGRSEKKRRDPEMKSGLVLVGNRMRVKGEKPSEGKREN